MITIKKILYQPFFIRLFHWEYWPFNVVYVPVYIYWIWLCIKARSIFFFNASNPFIKNGGFLLESKKEIYDTMPQSCYPKTLFFKSGATNEMILDSIVSSGLQFPLIGKPDIGMRGMAVKKLDSFEDVLVYANSSRVNFLLQEFIPYKMEAGIFYYRFPGTAKGHISGIVEKEFLAVTGDGISTVYALLQKEKRFVLQIPVLKKMHKEILQKVPAKGEEYLLVPYGNHSRGAKFIDNSHLIDDALTNTIDELCKKVKGFYYGRLDIRYNTWEELKQGTNFSIIEMNGAGSEPTHIYDPQHSIFFAWKEIIRHLDILCKISILNHKVYNIPFMNLASGINMIRENNRYIKYISEEYKQIA